MRVVQSIASDHFRLFCSRGPADPPLLSGKNHRFLHSVGSAGVDSGHAAARSYNDFAKTTKARTNVERVASYAHRRDGPTGVGADWIFHARVVCSPSRYIFVGRLLEAVSMATIPGRVCVCPQALSAWRGSVAELAV